MVIEVYTDGSADNDRKRNVDGLGGYAFVVLKDGKEFDEIQGIDIKTNSMKMEIQAVIDALKYVKKNFPFNLEKVKIYSDSQVVVSTINDKWYEKWELTNFAFVKNKEMMKEFIELWKSFNGKAEFIKVRGHSGNFYNERADFLANDARKFLKKEWYEKTD